MDDFHSLTNVELGLNHHALIFTVIAVTWRLSVTLSIAALVERLRVGWLLHGSGLTLDLFLL